MQNTYKGCFVIGRLAKAGHQSPHPFSWPAPNHCPTPRVRIP